MPSVIQGIREPKVPQVRQEHSVVEDYEVVELDERSKDVQLH